MSPLPATNTASGPSRHRLNSMGVADVHARDQRRRGKIGSLSANALGCKSETLNKRESSDYPAKQPQATRVATP